MPRNQVDEDKDRTCSHGLHFCAQSYLSQYHGGNGKVVIVKINPADVCAIPSDYANAKGRCSKYLVFSDCAGYEAGQTFGALYRENPESAFDDGADNEYDSVGDVSRDAGYTAGAEDAEDGLVRNADEALSDVQDGTVNDAHFIEGYIEGYNEGYDAFYSQKRVVSAPKAKVAKKTISESTRQKLRDAAARQRRDADGKYC
jgi:hypothetical protein